MNVIYVILSFATFIFMGAWGRPGPLGLVEKAEKSARIFGIMWLCVWPITIILFFFMGFTLNIWSILYVLINGLTIAYMIREFFFKKTRDLLLIIGGNNYGGFLIIVVSVYAMFAGMAAVSG